MHTLQFIVRDKHKRAIQQVVTIITSNACYPILLHNALCVEFLTEVSEAVKMSRLYFLLIFLGDA